MRNVSSHLPPRARGANFDANIANMAHTYPRDVGGIGLRDLPEWLKRLGLLKKDYLQNPYALADVEKEDDD